MNIRRLLGTLACVAMVAGCSATGTSPSSSPVVASTAGATPVASSSDASSSGVSSSGASSSGASSVVRVVNGQASLKESYATIRDLASSKNAIAIIRGTVTSTRDVYLAQFGYRILSVDVAESLRGQPDKQITVLEDGGLVPYATAAADISRKDGDLSTPPDPAGVIDFRFMGARHSSVGDEVVLFLGLNPNRGTVIETQYNIVSSVEGRFTLDTKTNQFVRALGMPDRPGFVRSVDIGKLKSEIASAYGPEWTVNGPLSVGSSPRR